MKKVRTNFKFTEYAEMLTKIPEYTLAHGLCLFGDYKCLQS